MLVCGKRNYNIVSSFYSFFMQQTSQVLYGIRVCGLSDVTDSPVIRTETAVLQRVAGDFRARKCASVYSRARTQHVTAFLYGNV